MTGAERQGERPSSARQRIAPARRLFLERRGYTLRRLTDAVRLLPILGLLLWMLPLIWPQEPAGDAVRMSAAYLYIFAVWYLLILFGAILAVRLRGVEDSGAADVASAAAAARDSRTR